MIKRKVLGLLLIQVLVPVQPVMQAGAHSHIAAALYRKRENDEHFLFQPADDIQTPPPNLGNNPWFLFFNWLKSLS